MNRILLITIHTLINTADFVHKDGLCKQQKWWKPKVDSLKAEIVFDDSSNEPRRTKARAAIWEGTISGPLWAGTHLDYFRRRGLSWWPAVPVWSLVRYRSSGWVVRNLPRRSSAVGGSAGPLFHIRGRCGYARRGFSFQLSRPHLLFLSLSTKNREKNILNFT